MIRYIFTLIILVLVSINIHAEDNDNASLSNNQITFLQKDSRAGHNRRPKSPDRQIITCEYTGDTLRLSLTIPEGFGNLYVYNDNNLIGNFDIDTTSLDINIPVGSLSGNIYIELSTEKENIYSGTLSMY